MGKRTRAGLEAWHSLAGAPEEIDRLVKVAIEIAGEYEMTAPRAAVAISGSASRAPVMSRAIMIIMRVE